MLLSDFDYSLPQEQIAQRPLEKRSESRMLVVDRTSGCWKDCYFQDLPSYLCSGDNLIFNNTRVIPARLIGNQIKVSSDGKKNKTPSAVELLLVRQVKQDPVCWEALARPGRHLGIGKHICLPENIEAVILKKSGHGLLVVKFSISNTKFMSWLDRIGQTPLPPYIKVFDEATDRERYQTIFAQQPGSVAAPTAGLHFTTDILDTLHRSGVNQVELTLHVGLGTFQPIRTEKVTDHIMHSEPYHISRVAAEQLKNPTGRRVAIGTTTVRVLEHKIRTSLTGEIEAGEGNTDIFITPGFKFRATDALLTNFHMPKSTLLMLVCAFAGQDLILSAYRHAVKENYRFYSYGDCMLIV